MTENPRPRRRYKLRITLVLLVLVLLALLIPPYVSLNRYHNQMIAHLSASLGRNVSIQSMHLRLLPTPGIVMEGVTVEEDPSFGHEPALIAPSVTATLRISSLWRQTIEISSIDMDSPSVNLVRNAQGEWSFGTILLQAARSSHAPTTQRYASAAPRFPYIGMSDARINFKDGLVKLPFSLFDTDLALWQSSPDRWRVRLEGQPVRTDLDLDLADTGTLKLNGWIGRTTNLHSMPIHLDASWQDAQMGQASRLIFGADEGWRGQLQLDGKLHGTLENLTAMWHIHLDTPHRIEFTPATSPNFDVVCRVTYDGHIHAIHDLSCLLPTPPGHLLLTGSIANLLQPEPSLQLEVNHLPAALVVESLGMLRQRAGSIGADGVLNGMFYYGPQPSTGVAKPTGSALKIGTQSAATQGWRGQLTADALELHIAGMNAPVAIDHLLLSTAATGLMAAQQRGNPQDSLGSSSGSTKSGSMQATTLTLAPISIPFGGKTPLSLTGSLTRSGFVLNTTGQASIANLVALHQQLGAVPDALDQLAPTGTAQMNLTFAGPWIAPVLDLGSGLSLKTQGTLSLSHAVFHPAYLTEPAKIADADLTLTPTEVSWNNAAFTVGALSGQVSLSYPMACPTGTVCPSQFTLELPKANIEQLVAAFTGSDAHGVLWADLMAHLGSQQRVWPSASGAIHIGSLTVGSLLLKNALVNASVAGTYLKIASLDASALGGSLHAKGSINASGDAPQWSLALNGEELAAPQVAALLNKAASTPSEPAWATGHGNLQLSLRAQGWSADQLASSATGGFSWTWKQGSLGKHGLLHHFDLWSAQGMVANQTLTLLNSSLLTAASAPPSTVTGSIGFNHTLHLLANTTATENSQPLAHSRKTSGTASTPSVTTTITVTGTLENPLESPTASPAARTSATEKSPGAAHSTQAS